MRRLRLTIIVLLCVLITSLIVPFGWYAGPVFIYHNKMVVPENPE